MRSFLKKDPGFIKCFFHFRLFSSGEKGLFQEVVPSFFIGSDQSRSALPLKMNIGKIHLMAMSRMGELLPSAEEERKETSLI